MAIFGALNALLKADNSAWNKGFKDARGEVDRTSAKTKGFFAELKSMTGKSSGLGQALKLAAGGGAVAAVGLAASKVKEVGQSFKELAEASLEGG